MSALLLPALLGVVVGLVVGGFGGGGGVLAVPALVLVLGLPAHDATTGSVLVVGITAVVGVLTHRHDVAWRTGLAFGAAGVPAAVLGSLLSRGTPEPVLLGAFAVLTVVAAVAMLVDPPEEHRTGGGTAVAVRTRRGVRVVVAGTAVGFLTGFLGVGGGFLAVPALVLALRLPMRTAVGTSLLVIVVNAVAATGVRLGDLHPDWTVLGPFTVAAVVGTLAGGRLAARLSGPVLARVFAVLLLGVGVATGVHAVVG